jgi:hypothetical protein
LGNFPGLWHFCSCWSFKAFSKLDIRVRVTGGGHTSQVYAIRQALAKAVVAFYAKYYGKTPPWSLWILVIHNLLTHLVSDESHIRRCLRPCPPKGAHPIRPNSPRCWPPTDGTQEIRRKGCSCSLPEIVESLSF